MKSRQVKLTDEEIKKQKKYKEKYMRLIKKELSFGDLANWENINSYWESYKHAKNLINNPAIEMPAFT